MLYCDTRLGGIARWSTAAPEDGMRIPDEMLSCVCFLAVQTAEGFRYPGTGFFIGLDSEIVPGFLHVYLVTAKHCVARAERYGGLYVRLNTHAGDSEFVHINTPWIKPEDPASDVAAIPWVPPQEKFVYKTIAADMFATPEVIKEREIGIGDEVFITGLFVKRAGKNKNLPILRGGIIAAMPDEPLKDKNTGLDYHAYIGEVRSIGGLSGSPVFVQLGPARPTKGKINLGQVHYFLLGLVRGHWDDDGKELIPLAAEDDDAASDRAAAINMGMAVFTPTEDLLKMLNSPEEKARRKKQEEKLTAKDSPTEDSALPEENFSKADFESALKTVSRKLSDEEKSGT